MLWGPFNIWKKFTKRFYIYIRLKTIGSKFSNVERNLRHVRKRAMSRITVLNNYTIVTRSVCNYLASGKIQSSTGNFSYNRVCMSFPSNSLMKWTLVLQKSHLFVCKLFHFSLSCQFFYIWGSLHSFTDLPIWYWILKITIFNV